MMRIAYFLADHGIPVFGNKGASVHVRALADAMCMLGHDITIFCTKRGNAGTPSRYVVIKIASQLPAEVIDEADPLAHRRAKERRYMASAAAMQEAFAVMHAEQPFDAIYERYSLWSAAGVEVARACNIPVIVEVNAPLLQEQQCYRQLALAKEAEVIERQVFEQADAVVAVSAEVADYVRCRGGDKTVVEVISNAVDESLFHPGVLPGALPEADGRCVIGFCGSLKAWHGVDILMDAFRELNRRHAGLHLLVVGDGPKYDWLQGYADGAGLADRVTLTGWVEHEQTPALLARSDILVAPYPDMDDFYFSPLKLFEYLALGKPVVASDIGQIKDVVETGTNGLLVPAGDCLALVEALQCLIVDAELRETMMRGAIDTASRYTWRGNAQSVIAMIEQRKSGTAGGVRWQQ